LKAYDVNPAVWSQREQYAPLGSHYFCTIDR
jgi:hypothetical protein